MPFGDEDDDGKLEAWCNLIDKGGLNHVNDKTYTLFFAMEDESGLLSLNIRPVALAMLHLVSHASRSTSVLGGKERLVTFARYSWHVGMQL